MMAYLETCLAMKSMIVKAIKGVTCFILRKSRHWHSRSGASVALASGNLKHLNPFKNAAGARCQASTRLVT